MENHFTPLKPSQRVEFIDMLRGLAILGILMVNMPYMFEPVTQMLAGFKPGLTLSGIISESFIKFLFEGKFYVLFSMLFGYGFWVIINKSSETGNSITPFYLRRIAILLLFGIIHITFFWAGDILVFYAFFGFVLLLFRKSSDRKILRWAFALILIPSLLSAGMVGMVAAFSGIPQAKEAMDAGIQENYVQMMAFIEEAAKGYSTGSFWEISLLRLDEYSRMLPGIFFFYPVVLGMILTGVYVARKGIFREPSGHMPFIRRVFYRSLAIGLISNITYVISYRETSMLNPSFWTLLSTSMHTVGGISFGFMYASGLLLLSEKGRAVKLRQILAPVGRMALTNYLMHSAIASFLFYSYGFGLFRKIEIWQGILITLAIFIIQIFFSRWWLNRFQFGPLEWVWRSLSYGKKQAMKIEGK